MAFYQSPTRNLPDGYTFRGATINDIPVVANLFNQQLSSFKVAGHFPIDEMRSEWQTPLFKPAIDVRLVLDQREHMIGYIEVWTTPGLASHPWVWGCVHPDYEGRGIGTVLLRWAEARARLSSELVPAHLRVAPQFGTQSTLSTVPALCQNLGWQLKHADPGITLQARKPGSAARLAQNGNLPANCSYVIYEKEIRPGKEISQDLL